MQQTKSYSRQYVNPHNLKDFGLEEVAQPVLKLVSNIMNEYRKV